MGRFSNRRQPGAKVSKKKTDAMRKAVPKKGGKGNKRILCNESEESTSHKSNNESSQKRIRLNSSSSVTSSLMLTSKLTCPSDEERQLSSSAFLSSPFRYESIDPPGKEKAPFAQKNGFLKNIPGQIFKEVNKPACTNPTGQPLFPARLQQLCVKCGFTWTTQDDLRRHRDNKHKESNLIDLMAMDSSEAGSLSPNAVKDGRALHLEINEPSNFVGERSRRNLKNYQINYREINPEELMAMQNGNVNRVYRPSAPVPDASFTEKEVFLHSLGLSYQTRLKLYLHCPVPDLQLPTCSVNIERMSDSDYLYYYSKLKRSTVASQEEEILGFHFMLGL